MAKSRNTYAKGLNRDLSRSKYGQDNYYDALNIRVVTEGGLSTGSIENELGNTLTFSIPTIPEQTITYTDTTSVVIPAQSNLTIIGWTTI